MITRRVYCLTASLIFVAAAMAGDSERQPVSPLSDLLDEAALESPDILAARRAWQAAAQVPSQVATRPDPQVTLQHLAVGSPRPFAGFSNSDFAYVGFGIS